MLYKSSPQYLTRTVILLLVLVMSTSVIDPAAGLTNRQFDMEFGNDLSMYLNYQFTFPDDFAFTIRDQIDNLQGVGNDNGFIEQNEVDGMIELMKTQELQRISISMDGTNAKLVKSTLVLDNLGTDAHSRDQIYLNFSLTLEWPSVDINGSTHTFEKMQTEPMTKIKISLSKQWEITKYTGINNSKLSSSKRSVSGYEWPGYKVVVDFKKVEKDDDDGLPGFDAGIVITALSTTVIVLARKKERKSRVNRGLSR